MGKKKNRLLHLFKTKQKEEKKADIVIEEVKEGEVKETALVTNVNHIVLKLLKIMKKHIGENNKISRRSLFIKVYKVEPELLSELQEYILWDILKRGMHRCRQRTKAFIVSKLFKKSAYSAKDKIGGVWHYWVADDVNDFHIYRDNINRNIKAMRNMVNKCEKAVDQEWWKSDWLDEYQKPKK